MTQTHGSPPSTDERSQSTTSNSPRRPTAAAVRKALVQTLAVEGPATAKTLEAEIGRLLPAAERPSVKQQLQVLREEGYVIDAPEDHRRLMLSESGRRWSRGIEALQPRAA